MVMNLYQSKSAEEGYNKGGITSIFNVNVVAVQPTCLLH